VNDEKMKPLIRIADKAGRGTCGPRRIQTELQSTGTFLGRDQIARLRREMRMNCIQKRKFKATTNSAYSLPVVGNLLDQQFTVSDPGTVYGTDITYIWTDQGWLYLAGVKDLATKEIIGHSMASRMSKELTHTALGMRPSMSRKRNCYDNAPVESFWGTMKEELVYHRRFRARVEAQAAIQEYIEVSYNRMRLHSALGNLAPAVFAENYLSERRSA
jgi:putative transposase